MTAKKKSKKKATKKTASSKYQKQLDALGIAISSSNKEERTPYIIPFSHHGLNVLLELSTVRR
jgi:hypothetical protein